jgi:biopolymer transport protein ExbD
VSCQLGNKVVKKSMDFFATYISYKTKCMNAIETGNSKKDIRIDFAPMVDLGFLLITFFIFTTKMQESKAFGLNMPADGVETEAMNSATITLTMKQSGVIDYLEGSEQNIIQKGTVALYGKPSLRDQLINKRKRIIQQLGSDSNYTVLIQPSKFTNYKELIDVLDEMTINDIKKYVLMDEKTDKQ